MDGLRKLLDEATKGPWPIEYTGDHKRIVVGKGLVEGPGGYEVAEVYSDDCPREVSEANARLIAMAPDLAAALLKAEEALAGLAVKYKAANPMRTADYHGNDCACLRCAFDNLDATLTEIRKLTGAA